MEQSELDQAIEAALEGAPRAEQLTTMIEALKERRAAMLRGLQATSDAARKRDIQKQIAELEQQIAKLSEQRAISHFVEMSVRVSSLRSIETEAVEDIETDEG